jgi:hypothetical protein
VSQSPREKPLAAAQRRLGKPGRPRTLTTEADTNARRPPLAPTAAPVIPPRLLDVDAAAAYLSVSSWTIRDLEAAGRLPRVRLPLNGERELKRLLFDRTDLDRLVERSKDTP